jgi:hypothetical protein
MKSSHLFLLVCLLGTMASCHDKAIGFTYTIENKLPYAIEVRYKDYRSVNSPDSSVFINSNTMKNLAYDSWRGPNKDMYPDTLSLLSFFYSLQIYRADTLLIKRNMTARKEWIFSQIGDEEAAYLLIIDQDDLK